MKRTKLIGVFSLVAFVIAVILSVLDATVLATRAINPILFGLGVLLLGLGSVLLVFAFLGKSGGLTMGGSIAFALGVLYFCLDFIEPINWALVVVLPIGFFVFFVGLSFVLSFKGTEIEFDNDKEDYKTFKQRQEDADKTKEN